MSEPKTILIIGAGIAGLSAGVFAQINGYRSRILEMHNLPGGLMTAWKRKGYTIDGCIHWLSGSSPAMPGYYQDWEAIGLVQGRQMFDPEIFCRIEGQGGQAVNFYSNIDRLEQHLLELAPEDAEPIRDFCKAARMFAHFDPPGPIDSLGDVLNLLPRLPGLIRALPMLRTWSQLTMAQFAQRLSNPFLRDVFENMWMSEMSAIGLPATLGMLHRRAAGYPIGGSLPMARAVEQRYYDLGGEIEYNARVCRILVENGKAAGVELADGRVLKADVVISAADLHATIYDMLGGQYKSEKFEAMFREAPIFEPLVYIGLGVKREFSDFPQLTGGLSVALDEPVEVAGKPVRRLEYQIYNFDPTLAPAGCTAVTVGIQTEHAWWKELAAEPERYEAEKQRLALEVIDRLDRRFPGLAAQVEMADVATPLTFEHYTGNWQGSFEGWLPTPKLIMGGNQYTLPGLENFYLVGQWVQPGGGLPSGTMTAKAVLKMLCKKDGKKFKMK